MIVPRPPFIWRIEPEENNNEKHYEKPDSDSSGSFNQIFDIQKESVYFFAKNDCQGGIPKIHYFNKDNIHPVGEPPHTIYVAKQVPESNKYFRSKGKEGGYNLSGYDQQLPESFKGVVYESHYQSLVRNKYQVLSIAATRKKAIRSERHTMLAFHNPG